MIKMYRALYRVAGAVIFLVMNSSLSYADQFSISFEWGNTPSCSGDYPDVIANPAFVLSNVPGAAAKISFVMVDFQSSYDHGGGKADYTGQKIVEPGAFQYDGPCPLDGSHTYQWTAAALDANGKVLAKASAQRYFPE